MKLLYLFLNLEVISTLFINRKYRNVNMSLFKRLKRKGVSDEKTKREGNLSGSPVSPANVAELRVSDVMGIL